MKITIVGTGRAGSSFDIALRRVGHEVSIVHHDELSQLGAPELLMLCVPDDEIAVTADGIGPRDDVVVAHVAGSRSLAVLASHPRVASLHPLTTLPSGVLGAERLIGATYCVAGDGIAAEVVASLGGRTIALCDDQRTTYHAAAVVASNHLVTLMGQVQILATSIGLSLEDFLPLAGQSLVDVARLGPVAALTGPASRGDMATIDAHLAAMPESARSTYVALANAAFELAELRRSQTPA